MIDQRPVDEEVGKVAWPLEDRIQALEARLKRAEELLKEWSDNLDIEDYGTTECEKERQKRTQSFLAEAI